MRNIVSSAQSNPIFKGKYIKLAIVRVGRPEKLVHSYIESHKGFSIKALRQSVEYLCILSAGVFRPYWAKKLREELEREEKLKIIVEDHYIAKYKGVNTYVYCALLKKHYIAK